MPTIAPYGSWKSPITAESIVADSVGLGQIELEGDDIYWVEMRPQEGARNVVVRRSSDGSVTDVTPAPFNVRTRVHEYGGRSFVVDEGTIYFSNFADQRVYRRDPGSEPRALTPEVDLRYADSVVDRRRGRIICIREDHTVEGQEAVNTLVSLDLEHGGEGDVLVSGADFYSSPALSPDGTSLAWLAWRHPNMPWDGTELRTADIADDGSLTNSRMVAGGLTESIFQPEWSPDGVLYFVSDRSGWWCLYRIVDGDAQPLAPMEAEFGAPQWAVGMKTYAFESARRIVCEFNERGIWSLASIDTETLELTEINSPYTDTGRGDIKASPGQVVFEASSATEPDAIVRLNTDTGARDVLKRSEEVEVDESYLSTPETIEFPTDEGMTSHAFYYPARNVDYDGPDGERPPLLVVSHGGPTGAASTSFSLAYQFWTSRGIAVADVNYGGSTGYGTEYRRRLNGRWGIVDIADCVNAAQYLVDRGDVDGDRLIIRGGSAGGTSSRQRYPGTGTSRLTPRTGLEYFIR